jgi:hypothetical protein
VLDKNKFLSFELVNFSIRMNFPDLNSQKTINNYKKYENKIIKDLIRLLTVEYLYKFHIPIQAKQRLLKKIKYYKEIIEKIILRMPKSN